MDYFFALILGTIEGMTEFLPISSTGHLILASRVFHVPETEFWKTFIVVVQLGAILAVLVLYGRRMLGQRQLLQRVIVAFLPTAVIGLLTYKIVKAYLLENVSVVLTSLFVGGLLLIVFEYFFRPKSAQTELSSVSYRQALGIGCFQALAIIPGVSRAASTIIGGMLLGVSRTAIVEFSFFLAVPTMLAASGLDLLKSGFSYSVHDDVVLAVGFASAFVTALIAVRTFLRFIQRHTFVGFGIYRILIALLLFFVLTSGW